MVETLFARTALGHVDGALRMHGSATHAVLSELTPAAMIDLRLNPTDVALLTEINTASELQLPLTPGTFSTRSARSALWFGPDQWLILAPSADADSLVRVLAPMAGSAVDVSDLRAEFELAGPLAPDVLRKGCSIDLHPRVFGPGDCALTTLARVRIALRQIDERPAYRLLVERSVAPYLWDWLIDAMREFTAA
jgi:sarcosine oxidase subunit gamma